MDGNNYFLKIVTAIAVIISIAGCFNNEERDGLTIEYLKTQYLSLDEAEGEYFFVPSYLKEDYPNYETFGLNIGDTLFLKIRRDSSFWFNHFYYENLSQLKDYTGHLIEKLGEPKAIFIPFPENAVDLQGFKTISNDTFFFTHLNIKNYSGYEYQLFYKKKRK